MNKRQKRLHAQMGTFVKQYGRKAQRGKDPNDRPHSRYIQGKVKRMTPEEFDSLLKGEEEGEKQ